MGRVACYNKKRTTVEKSYFISTENMRQNCNGIEPYNDPTNVDGVAFCENDILIANIRPYLKKAWKAQFNGACSTDVLSINPTGIDADFLFHCIEKDDFFNYVMSAAKGSKMPRGDKQHIMEYTISFPSEPEQKMISSFIESLSLRITTQSKLVECLKLYKRGVLSNLFDEDSEHIKAWKKYQIGDFLSSRIIKQVPSEDAPLMAFTAEGGVEPKGDRYDRSFLVKDENKQYKRTEYNDFIYSSNNLDVGSIGLNKYGTAVISDVYEIFEISNAAHPTFISEAIKQPHTLHKILKYRQGVTYGQYRIYAEDFQSVDVLLPSYDEQCKFALLLDNLDNSIKTQASILYNLQIYKKALLQQMFI